jgi:hypothetical protein
MRLSVLLLVLLGIAAVTTASLNTAESKNDQTNNISDVNISNTFLNDDIVLILNIIPDHRIV